MRFLIWRFGEKGEDLQIKNSPISVIVWAPMALRIQIAKLKIHQYLLRANSPNLMLAKFSLYTSEQMDFNFSVDIPWTAYSWQVFIKLIQLSS